MLGVGAALVGLRDTVYSLISPQRPEDAVSYIVIYSALS